MKWGGQGEPISLFRCLILLSFETDTLSLLGSQKEIRLRRYVKLKPAFYVFFFFFFFLNLHKLGGMIPVRK